MIIFSRIIAIGGDVGVTYPKKGVTFNNYFIVNEKYYLSHSVDIYLIIFPFILMFFLKYIY